MACRSTKKTHPHARKKFVPGPQFGLSPRRQQDAIRGRIRCHQAAKRRSLTGHSGAGFGPDEIEDMLIALTRAGVISEQQRFDLHAAYLRQKGGR